MVVCLKQKLLFLSVPEKIYSIKKNSEELRLERLAAKAKEEGKEVVVWVGLWEQ